MFYLLLKTNVSALEDHAGLSKSRFTSQLYSIIVSLGDKVVQIKTQEAASHHMLPLLSAFPWQQPKKKRANIFSDAPQVTGGV